jgi:hypothetical protein
MRCEETQKSTQNEIFPDARELMYAHILQLFASNTHKMGKEKRQHAVHHAFAACMWMLR